MTCFGLKMINHGYCILAAAVRAVDREFVDIYVLKPSCGRLGASCGCLGASWSRLGASWSNLGADLELFGAVVGRSWGHLGGS